jgi:hypothetical protein
MALHAKWSSGHLIFHDGSNDIMEIKNSTDGVDFPQGITTTGGMTLSGTVGAVTFSSGITVTKTATFSSGVTFSGLITYPDPATATGNMTTTGSLVATDNRIQFVNSTTARNLYLAQASGCAGIEFKIFTGAGTGAITIKEAVSSSTIVTLGASEGAIVVSDGADWRGLVGANT